MSFEVHRFSVCVNCILPNDGLMTDSLQDKEMMFEDHGFIMLPDSYTDSGKATRLVIFCHGAGGTVTTDDSQVEHSELTKYLVANGYAVMDVNGLPSDYAQQNGIDIRNNIGSPIAIRSYVKAYHYCMDTFNLKTDVFVHGASMGGISSANLVLSGQIPVIAHSAFCPVLDTYNQIFLHPWSGGLPKVAMGKMYRFDIDELGEYIYDEKKLFGFNPASNKKAETYPVPLKFWHCIDDDTVSYDVTRRFVEVIKNNGGTAILRTFPYGGHEPQFVGDVVKSPVGKDMFCGEKIKITPAIEEAFVWVRNYD
ncbi:MAG: alpha/beta hydrolase [Ruminococcaceae bacterium]|nr:alpha/beta hydrolase [Oscillospiraceae bacterium]